MLEEILKNINSNLERIATCLEKNKAINLESKAFNNQNTEEQTNANPIVNNAPIQNSVPVVQETVQQTNSIIQTHQPVQNNVIPTTVAQESFTQDQLAVAMSNAVSAGKMNVIQGIMQQLGVQALTQVNPADYNRVASMLKEAGVEV